VLSNLVLFCRFVIPKQIPFGPRSHVTIEVLRS